MRETPALPLHVAGKSRKGHNARKRNLVKFNRTTFSLDPENPHWKLFPQIY